MLYKYLQTHQKKGGALLKRMHCKRVMVPTRKQAAHKLSGTKSSLFSIERVSGPLYRQDSTCGNQQHYSRRRRRRDEVGPTMCPSMENLDLVYQSSSNSQRPTHSRPAERGSRQTILFRPDHSNRLVPPSRGLQHNMQQVARPQIDLFATRLNNKLPLFVSPVPDPLATAVDALSLAWEDLDSSHLGQSGGEVTGLPMQENHSDCSSVAQHALVLGSSGNVQSDSTESP